MNVQKMMEDALEREYRTILGGSASTAQNADNAPVLTLDVILDCQRELTALQEAPYRKLLSDNCFDPDRDMIIFSRAAAQGMGFDEQQIPETLRRRVRIVDIEGGCYLIRNTLPNINIGEVNEQ